MRWSRSLSPVLVPCTVALIALVSSVGAAPKETAAVRVMTPQSINVRGQDGGNGFIYAVPFFGPVDVFPRDGTHQQPVGTIAVPKGDSPAGCAVDQAGNVYLSSPRTFEAPFGPVLVYRPGQTTPYFAYTAHGLEPEAVAVGDDGTVHVVSFSQYLYDFKHGDSTPIRKVFLGRGVDPYAIEADRHGTVYILGSRHHQVLKVDPGAAHPDRLALGGFEFPGGVAVDDAGNLLISATLENAVFVYPPGRTTPSQAITTGLHQPYDIKLTPTKLFVVTADRTNGPERVRIFDYPSGRLVNSVAVNGHDYHHVCVTSELP